MEDNLISFSIQFEQIQSVNKIHIHLYSKFKLSIKTFLNHCNVAEIKKHRIKECQNTIVISNKKFRNFYGNFIAKEKKRKSYVACSKLTSISFHH